jgi:predicted RNase H-like HicB family nuclease
MKFHAIFEKGEKYFIGYCPEVPGANGQGETIEACKSSLMSAIELIFEFEFEEYQKKNLFYPLNPC